MKNIFLYGGGGYFKEQYVWLKDCLIEKKDYQVAGIIDDLSKASTDNFSGLKIFKTKQIKFSQDIYIYLASGDVKVRKKAIDYFKNFNFFTLKHPSAIVSSEATFGKGITISPNVIIAGNPVIGDFNNFNFGSMVSHDCVCEINNTFSPGVKIMGNCKIGNYNFFGADSVMIPFSQIGDKNIIGANATITKKFESGMTLVGSPASHFRERYKNFS
jgi:sugar O-acyltransferase (sialic acid O-acetyltransferase NeuD family)